MSNNAPNRHPSTAPRLVARDRQLTGDALMRFKMRLSLVSGMGLLGHTFFLVVLLLDPRPAYQAMFGETLGVSIGLVVVSLVAFTASRSQRIPAWKVPRIALAYMVLGGLGLALLIDQLPWPTEIGIPGWSPVAVWVLATSLVMVFRPKATLIAGLVTTIGELGIVWVLARTGVIELPPREDLGLRFGPNIMAPVLASIANLLVWRMTARLEEAEELGSYRLAALIGKGGMGEVWRATHRMLKRAAAVKLINPQLLGEVDAERALKRFEREAQATAALRSPHTIEIYDFGVAGSGSFFYVMELLDGLDLSTIVDRYGPLPAERVVHLLLQACHSLEEAHARGLVHRDIKPANLFVCRYGTDTDFVKVLDFGLVKQAQIAAEATRLTMDGAISGTPAYMAPEQVMGDEIDGRTDLYSLGCVAWFLLTGRDPFEGRIATQVMFAHLNSEPAAPSSASELPIPAELDAIVLDCLNKAPADRPATADALAARLTAVTIEPAWSEARARVWWDKQLPSDDALARRGTTTVSGKRTTG